MSQYNITFDTEYTYVQESLDTLDKGINALEHLLTLHGIAKEGTSNEKEYLALKVGVESVTETLYGEAKPVYAAESLAEAIGETYAKIKNAILGFFKWLGEKVASFYNWVKGMMGFAQAISNIEVDPAKEQELKTNAQTLASNMEKVKENTEEIEEKLKKAVQKAKENPSESKNGNFGKAANVNKNRRKKVVKPDSVKDFSDLGKLINNDGDTPSMEEYDSFMTKHGFAALENFSMSGDAVERVLSGSPDITLEEMRAVAAMVAVVKINKLNAVQASIFMEQDNSTGKVTVNYAKVLPFYKELGNTPNMDACRSYLRMISQAIEWINTGNDKAAFRHSDKIIEKALIEGLNGKITRKEQNGQIYYDVSMNGLSTRLKMDINKDTGVFDGFQSLSLVFGKMVGEFINREYYIDLASSDTLSQARDFAKVVTRSGYVGNAKRTMLELTRMKDFAEKSLVEVEKEVKDIQYGRSEGSARSTYKGIGYLRSSLYLFNAAYRMMMVQAQMTSDVNKVLNIHGRMFQILAKSA